MKNLLPINLLFISIYSFSQNFTLVNGTPFAGVKFSSVAFADVDKDNDQDVFITGNEGSSRTTKLYTNSGNGTFTLSSGSLFAGVDLSSVAFADVDNDNDMDVFVGGTTGSSSIAYIYRNNGSGIFTAITGNPFLGPYNGSVAFADVDKDNDQDVFICVSQTGKAFLKLYKNLGGGLYALDTTNSFIPVFSSSVAFSDVDNDGDNDLLISGNSGSNPVTNLYLNNGGIFTVSSTAFTAVRSGDVAFADIDNDNDKDVLITGDDGTYKVANLYTNNGSGIFTLVNATPFTGVYLSSVAFADVDNDSDADVIIGGNDGSSNTCKLYNNNGLGAYTLATGMPFSTINNGAIAFADIDGDTDQDVLITGASGTGQIANLYKNNKIVGIKENSFNQIQLFPNPSKGLFTIEQLTNKNQIQIFNTLGEIIFSAETTDSSINIDLSEHSSGLYFITVLQNQKIIQKGILCIE